MNSLYIRSIGFWSGIVLVILGIAYLGLIAAMMISGSGFPPIEPFQTMFNILIMITAAWMVFFWSILHQVTPVERKLFSQASLGMIVIFAALTSINRYVGLTVVRQSIASGSTDGLQWFLPYGSPSIMLALEILAWGFFFGLACLSLAPVFMSGKLEHTIFWTLIAIGSLSLLAALGQILNSAALNMLGFVAWRPGLIVLFTLLAFWFKKPKHIHSHNGQIMACQ